MPPRLGIGIIGLGRRWRRYRPALAELRGRLVVRAICDQRPARAERTARELGCAAAAGPTDLLDRDDVEAVLLLDEQWFGLWPLEQAARKGKPVFCALSPACDDAHADDVMRQVRETGSPVMWALWSALSPAVTRLADLLATRLGPPRLVRCDWCGLEARKAAGMPGGRVLPALMHACACLIGDEPLGVWATAAPAARFGAVLMSSPKERRPS
jgi:predicted dehydrogenase